MTPSAPRRRRNRRFKLWFGRLFWTAVVIVLIFIIFIIGALAWYSRSLPDPNKILERNVAQSTKIYDRTSQTVLYDVHGTQKRTLVKIEEIPDDVKWATISAEDKHFYEHKGFNLLATFKGVIVDPLLGRRARGGSTLTQQLVKNVILTNERSIARKLKEFVLSYKLEKVFTKDEILQMYLNEVPYGSVSYGVQSASQTYFNKDVKDLNLAESAVLAAIPKAPTYYSPYGQHRIELLSRQKYVLGQMVENGYITQAESDAAAKVKINFALKREAITAPHFVMYVKQLLSEKLGEELVENGGLKVTTTLDLTKQKIAEQAVVKGVEDQGKQYNFRNAALLSMDPKTGQILAMVGSKDYFDLSNDGNVNVTLSLRQPGSSIKPIIYAVGFQKGYTPNTVLFDTETTFKTETQDYHPHDYDLKERGPMTIRQALAQSRNIPAVKMIYLVGVQTVLNQLELMGYTSFEDRSRFGLSLVLGGGEVRLLEHVAGYAAFANEGVYHPPSAILKVEDSHGNVLWEYKDSSRQVFEKNIANQITNILSDTSVRLSANLNLKDRPVAAKTGTTNNYWDAWTMGYTPSLVTGVWVGNNDNTAMSKGADGTVIAAPIWQNYMNEALKGTLAEEFSVANIEMTGKPVLDGDVSLTKLVKVDKYTGQLATDLTPPSFIEERSLTQAHCILYYVQKDDPRGPAPMDPVVADSAYVNWEAGVQDWLMRTMGQVSGSVPLPSGYDSVHVEANRPTVFIVSPNNGATLNTPNLLASVRVSAPRGVSRVEYYIDDRRLSAVRTAPFDLNYNLATYFSKGFHKLKVKAYDDVDNSNEAQIDLNILLDFPKPTLQWLSPASGASLVVSDFPVPLSGRLTDQLASRKVDFFQRQVSSGQVNQFGALVLPQQENFFLNWPAVFEKGAYQIYAEIRDESGNKYQSPELLLTVN